MSEPEKPKSLYNNSLYYVINSNESVNDMVQAIVTLGEHEDRILTIVKGKFGLKNKSDAINKIIDEYEAHHLEPELRPEYAEKLQKIKEQKGTRFKSVSDLRRQIEHA
jgi:hypothetical protein